MLAAELAPTVIAGVLAMVAGVVGAGVNGYLSRRADRQRWQRERDLRAEQLAREDRLRWVDHRRVTYAAYLEAARQAPPLGAKAFEVSTVPKAGAVHGALVEEMRRDFAAFDVAIGNMSQLLGEIGLMGSATTRVRAEELMDAVTAYINVVVAKGEEFEQMRAVAGALIRARTEAFREAARRDLGIQAEELADRGALNRL